MNILNLRFNPIVQNIIIFVLILFAFNFINEKPFIKLYQWPNFGDNYIFGLIFVSLFLIKKLSIRFNSSDLIFIGIMLYVILMEAFYFSGQEFDVRGDLHNFTLVRDLFAIFYVFKIFSIIEFTNKAEKIIKYSSFIFIFLTISYFIIYLSLHHKEFEFNFINYGDPSLRNQFFFQIFFLFLVCAFFRFNKLAVIFYFSSALILFYFPSRGQLLVFFIVIVPILLKYKFRIFYLIAHFILLYFVYFAEYEKSVENTIVPKKVYTESVEALKKDDRKVMDFKNHGEVNSTITRFYHIERNARLLKKNIFLGNGYNSLYQNEIKLIAKTCECLILHPLFSYGLIGQILLLIFIYFLYKDYGHHFRDLNSKLFLIATILLLSIYSISSPLFPAWFGVGFFLLIHQNKYEINNDKIINQQK